ncbi:hypothetical protein ANCCEY_05796 [Ancylostoma ceylanicum]|uniref:DNA2/NAM7 helicase-like C-terminal domain-containing protein n=1 Tax=Ancylostoma ceylanicum TaxID=53326 RepID=A0A0D6M5E1_9BILA|nr:hypothetical protein ANCCEY_05796 [Ancylostoma ceylanicum]
MRISTVSPSSEQKANLLLGYLDGVAREKIEELSLGSALLLAIPTFPLAEASVCQALVRGLLQRGVEVSSIAIITFYDEQHRYLEDFTKEYGIEIFTPDSVQGQEHDVIILLTTKIDCDPDGSEFLDAPQRMPVAVDLRIEESF